MIPIRSFVVLALLVGCSVRTASAFVVVPRSTTTSGNSLHPKQILLVQQQQPTTTATTSAVLLLQMAVTDESGEPKSTNNNNTKLPFFLDPGTKGGALVLMVVLFAVPLAGYQFMVSALGYDEIEAGVAVGMGFTVFSTAAWMSTYLFRVATKDMTYVRCCYYCTTT
jgi:Protein of unknown function (DUF3007)